MMLLEKGTLYLCATPIGNLDDITFRALEVLKNCDLIAAEDTRHTRKLLSHFDIHTPLTSFHAHNEAVKGEQLVEKLKEGLCLAVVSDAGMPGISDPGTELVSIALKNGINVVPIPGVSAGITALVVSGLPTARFVFEGFLPANKKGRKKKLEQLALERRTLVFYESPHRLLDTLNDMEKALGKRTMAVARELTKKHEEIYRGSIAEARDYFKVKETRGEFTLVVSGNLQEEIPISDQEEIPIIEQVHRLESQGVDKKTAIKEVAVKNGMPKRQVYAMVTAEKE